MRLPDYLETSIAELSAHADPKRLAAACRQLTERYKGANSAAPAVRDITDRIAYLATRLPATFAASIHVFSELRRRAQEVDVSSLLDLGAGPGTGPVRRRSNLLYTSRCDSAGSRSAMAERRKATLGTQPLRCCAQCRMAQPRFARIGCAPAARPGCDLICNRRAGAECC